MTRVVLCTISAFAALSGMALHKRDGKLLSSKEGKQICLVGASSLFAAYQLRSEHGRCNAITTAQKLHAIISGSASCVIQSVRKIWHRTVTKNNTLHNDALHHALVARERVMNAWYKLTGSTSRVVHLTPYTPLLVKTKNHPQNHLQTASALQQFLTAAKQFEPKLSYMYTLDFTQKIELHDGVCQGMVQKFVSEYHRLRAAALDVEAAATQAAKLFTEGGGAFSCIMQVLHLASKVDEEAFEKRFPDPSVRNRFRWIATSLLGHTLLNSSTIFYPLITFSSPDQISSLPNGIYELTSGYLLHGPSTDPYLTTATGRGHSMALIMEEGEFFIFDPNSGLVKHPNPYRYLEVVRKSDHGVLFCLQIHPPESSS